jgi:topoisomerase-4 subunit A
VDALLELRIRRISRFDIERNRKEIASLSAEVAKVERDLGGLVAYTIRYLQGMLRQYGDRYERRTRIASFGAVKVRDLTSRELRIQFDEEKGYLGCEVAGRLVLECSSYDRLMLFWGDGRYKVVAPPDKMFTDRNLVFCGRTERDRVMTVVYTLDRFSYLKRFAVGGAVLNREYRYVPEGARVLLFADDQPESVYVKYKPAKGQRIHQQVFSTRDVPVRGVKARGNQMTAKAIERAAGRRPRWWEEDATRPRGVLL